MPRNSSLVFVPSGPSLDADSKLLIKQHVMRTVACAAHQAKRKRAKGALRHAHSNSGHDTPASRWSIASQRHLASDIHAFPSEPHWLLGAVHYYNSYCGLDLDIYKEHWLHLSSFGDVASCAIKSLLADHVRTHHAQIGALPEHRRQSMTIHLEALNAVKVEVSRLLKMSAKPGNGIIAAIVALAYRSHIAGDVSEFNIHMGYLRDIVVRGGGVHMVDSVLQDMICCIDTIRACAADEVPWFSSCGQELSATEPQSGAAAPAITALIEACRLKYPGRESTIRLGQELWDLMVPSNGGRATDGAPCSVTIICDYLRRAQLCKRTGTSHVDGDPHIEDIVVECSRLSTMLVFMGPRRKLGMVSGVTEDYVSKLRVAIEQPADWLGMDLPKLWILTMAARESQGTENGVWFEQQAQALVDATPSLQDPELQDSIANLFFHL